MKTDTALVRLVLVLAVQALACAQPRPSFPTSEPSIAGWVTAINQTGERTGTIRVEERPTESAGSAKAVVRITPTTEILRADSTRAEFRSFVVGQWVRVWFIGPVRQSYPVQADAATVIIDPTIARYSATAAAAQTDRDAPASDSPLAAYPGFGHNREADEAQYLREEAQRQQIIARCMAAGGHSYVPVLPVRGSEAAVRTRSPQAPALHPNEAHAASLSPQERQRYYLALYGVPDPNAEGGPLWNPRSETGGGCWGEALRTIPGVYAAGSALVEPYIEMRRAAMRHQLVTAATQRWVECMRARGFHQYSSPQGVAGAADSAAIARPRDADAQRRAQAAMEAGRLCTSETGFAQAVSQARAEVEAEFVRAHKAQLDQHLERLRNQPPVP